MGRPEGLHYIRCSADLQVCQSTTAATGRARGARVDRAGFIRNRDADFPAVLKLQREIEADQPREIAAVDRSFDRARRRVRHPVGEHALEDLYLIADLPEH